MRCLGTAAAFGLCLALLPLFATPSWAPTRGDALPPQTAQVCPPGYPVDCGDYCCPDGTYCCDEGCCEPCPPGYPVDCGDYCCEAGSYCCADGCCIEQPSVPQGDECPAGSGAYCPATHPACVGWPGTNYVCCARDAVMCSVGSDVWCCNPGDLCGDFKGSCR